MVVSSLGYRIREWSLPHRLSAELIGIAFFVFLSVKSILITSSHVIALVV